MPTPPRIRLLLAIAVGALFLASPALATWTSVPDGPAITGVRPTGAGPNLAYYDFIDTTDSLPLAVSSCVTFDVFFDPDEDGTNTGATVFIRGAHENAANTATSWKILTDQDGGGLDNNALTGSDTSGLVAIYGAAAPYVWVDVQANGAADDARVVVKCNG